VRVYPTGSAVVLPTDRRAELARLEERQGLGVGG
jgi:hypothetical protein